ncbi:MAG: HTTM domain-containing protein, partial [Planctomycetaceae bacterium]|nr:HTTM domain-containing protein [Planctomycetaceae bacterium]
MSHDQTSSPRSLSQRIGQFVRTGFSEIPNDWLVVYRMAFGGVMLAYIWSSFVKGRVDLFYVRPIHHFPYPGWEWVEKLDLKVVVGEQVFHAIQLEYFALGVCSFLILIGFGYRLASIVFAVLFAHIFLIDKCYYQNHYYLVSLLGLLLPFLPANRAVSIDALLHPQVRSSTTPLWTLWLMRFQIGVPYLCGGLA